MNDPWWIVAIKAIGIVLLVLTWQIINVWFERRVLGKMQQRKGPIMNGPFGLGQTLGDGLKFLLKEDFAPGMVDKVLYTLAPLIAGVSAFTAWSVIPLGGQVNMFGVETRLQVADLPVSALVLLAAASTAVYGFVLAGYSSQSPYSLLGSMRSSAQMISYEISMGLSYVAVFLYAGSMSTGQIVEAQGLPLFGANPLGLQQWYWLLLLPSFVIYVISMLGESNRVPFDLPECESELVSGHITEYTGFRYAIFYLTEYINMTTLSAIVTTLFLGGYKAIWPLGFIFPDTGYWGLLWFVIKVQLFIFFFVWVRASLPRFRYDQFMGLGWKWLIPISLGWVMVIALLRALTNHGLLQGPLLWILIGVVVLGLIAVTFLGGEEVKDEPVVDDGPFDAFAGGYPVPPMPGQTLPELADVVAGSSIDTDHAAAAASDDHRKDA
ncbi:NADH-quinone oxidoreductase subunit NuoH [Propioniciclava sinopodophylli]|uniref:NADH-quinone oxidoreductase subunit H n=2 Tax=Propioniciclava sinopodophylli TaxID=1837344 RepID=A0A4Q9KCP7_9ACTN|nr:NADH-quinone oxidoreductase subunit NuoH [Propioniciclava sinopodophylli]